MHRALVEVRTLAERGRLRSLRGFEACWVGTSIDLAQGDLTSDAGGVKEPLLLEHIKAVGRRDAGRPIRAAEWKSLVKRWREAKTVVPFPGTAYERVLCAAGAAMALKAAGNHGVAVAYADLADLNGTEWKRVLTVMGQEGLPLILMVLPGASTIDLDWVAAKAAKISGSSSLAVPVIPVDAGDALAIYRVAQETAVRARAGGGAAAILGVACGTDAVKLLGTQLVRKRICTERWVNGVESQVRALLAAE